MTVDYKDDDNLFSEKEKEGIEADEVKDSDRSASKYSKNNDSSGDGTRKKRNRNLETVVVSIIFVGIFAIMVVYMAYYNNVISPSIEGYWYNPRTATSGGSTENVRRGSILTANGTRVAQTVLDKDKKEYRDYKYGKYFAVPVGAVSSGDNAIEGAFSTALTTSTNKTEVKSKASNVDGTEYYGDNVYTTLNFDMQKAAYDALGDNNGAVVAVEPSTGKILCMVSKPTFDPNTFNEDYDKLASSNNSVLLNRATQGLYTPGSTFKVATVLEYIKEHPNDYQDFTFTCTGSVQPTGGAKVVCQYNKAHGKETLTDAFVNSCNCAFSTIGTELDMKKFRELLENAGVNSDLGLEIASNKSVFEATSSSSLSELQSVAYGQGDTLLTPLQNLLFTSAVANGGTLMKPYLVDKVVAADGETVRKYSSIVKSTLCSDTEASVVGKLMKEMVSQSLSDIFTGSYSVCGKTGTAEYSDTETDKAHMWFTCYSPAENPKVAVIAICEKTDIDYTKSTTICKKVLDAYYYGYDN